MQFLEIQARHSHAPGTFLLGSKRIFYNVVTLLVGITCACSPFLFVLH